jgi:ribosomal protein S18 acetylase RimI-like enzyme
MLIFTTNKKKLLEHFRKDPVLFAYHIGDLDEFYFGDCQWATAPNQRTGLDDVLLAYSGGVTPTLLSFGLSDSYEQLLREYLPLAPRKFFCHFQKQHRSIFEQFASSTPLGTHLKMKLDPDKFAKFQATDFYEDDPDIFRLDESHETLLRKLYDDAYPDNYFVPRMLQTGKYFGLIENGRLVGVAGVHVSSDEYKIAVLGNITTHPDYRGRGLSTRLTGQLVADLAGEDKMVCLNVKSDNAAAIASYNHVGFDTVHEYEEAIFELK